MGDEVKKLVQGLRSGQVNVNLFCGQFKKLVEKRVLLTKGNLVAQLSNLRQAVEIFSHVRLSLPNSILVEEIGRDLFLKCARMVLSYTYLMSQPCQEINFFKNSVYRAEKMLRHTGYGHRFDMLRWLMYNNWKHPTLSKLIWGLRINEEVGTQYIKRFEFPELLKLRVEMLLDEGNSDLALNLCGWCLRVHMNDPFLLAVMLMFLHHQQKYNLFYSLCHCLNPCLCAQVLNYIEPEARLTQSYLVLSQTFLLQDWLKPHKYCCTRALLEHWLEAEYNMEVKPGDFEFAVLKVAECAHNRYQIMLLLRIIYDMFGSDHMQLYMDLCLQCLRRNIADLQLDCVKRDEREWKDAHTSLSYICTSLSCVSADWSLKLRRLSLLTAFSLEPRYDLFRALEKLYEIPINPTDTSADGNRSTETNVEPHASTSQSSSGSTASTSTAVVKVTCPPAQTSIYQGQHRTLQQALQNDIRGVSPRSLMEIIKTLDYLRIPGLDPTLPWETLKAVCFDYIEDGEVAPEKYATTHVPVISENDNDPLDILYTDCVKAALDEEAKLGHLSTGVMMPWEFSKAHAAGGDMLTETDVTPMEVDTTPCMDTPQHVTSVSSPAAQTCTGQTSETLMSDESEGVGGEMMDTSEVAPLTDASSASSWPAQQDAFSDVPNAGMSDLPTSTPVEPGPPTVPSIPTAETVSVGGKTTISHETSVAKASATQGESVIVPTESVSSIAVSDPVNSTATTAHLVTGTTPSSGEPVCAVNVSQTETHVIGGGPAGSNTSANIVNAETVSAHSGPMLTPSVNNNVESSLSLDKTVVTNMIPTSNKLLQVSAELNVGSPAAGCHSEAGKGAANENSIASVGAKMTSNAVSVSGIVDATPNGFAISSSDVSMTSDAPAMGDMTRNSFTHSAFSETSITHGIVPGCKQGSPGEDLATADVEIPRQAVSSCHEEMAVIATEMEKVCDDAEHSESEATSADDAECVYPVADDADVMERDCTNISLPESAELTPVPPLPAPVSDLPSGDSFVPHTTVTGELEVPDLGSSAQTPCIPAANSTCDTFSMLNQSVGQVSDASACEVNAPVTDTAAIEPSHPVCHTNENTGNVANGSVDHAKLLLLSGASTDHSSSNVAPTSLMPELTEAACSLASPTVQSAALLSSSASLNSATTATMPVLATTGLIRPAEQINNVTPIVSYPEQPQSSSEFVSGAPSPKIDSHVLESGASNVVPVLPVTSQQSANTPAMKRCDDAIVVASTFMQLNPKDNQSDFGMNSVITQSVFPSTDSGATSLAMSVKPQKPVEHTVMVASSFVQPDLPIKHLKQPLEKSLQSLEMALTQLPGTPPPIVLPDQGTPQTLLPKIQTLPSTSEKLPLTRNFQQHVPVVSERIVTKPSSQRMVPLKPKPPKVFEMPHMQPVVTTEPPVIPHAPQPTVSWPQITPQASLVTSNILDSSGVVWSQPSLQSVADAGLQAANWAQPNSVQMVAPPMLQTHQMSMPLGTLPLQMATAANSGAIAMVQPASQQIVAPQTTMQVPQVVAQPGLPSIINQQQLSEIVAQQTISGIAAPQQLPGIVAQPPLPNVLNQQQMSLVAPADASNMMLATSAAGLVLLVPNSISSVPNCQPYLTPTGAFSTQPSLAPVSQAPMIINQLTPSQTIADYRGNVLQSTSAIPVGTATVSVGPVLQTATVGTQGQFQSNQFQLPGNPALIASDLMPATNVVGNTPTFIPPSSKPVTVPPAIRPLVLNSPAQPPLTPALSSSMPVNNSFIAMTTSSFSQPPTPKLFQALTDLTSSVKPSTNVGSPNLKLAMSISAPIASNVSMTPAVQQPLKFDSKPVSDVLTAGVMSAADMKCPCGQLPQTCCCSPRKEAPVSSVLEGGALMYGGFNPQTSVLNSVTQQVDCGSDIAAKAGDITPVLPAVMATLSSTTAVPVSSSPALGATDCASTSVPMVVALSGSCSLPAESSPAESSSVMPSDSDVAILSDEPPSFDNSQDAGTQTDPVDSDDDDDDMDGFINSADAAAEAEESPLLPDNTAYNSNPATEEVTESIQFKSDIEGIRGDEIVSSSEPGDSLQVGETAKLSEDTMNDTPSVSLRQRLDAAIHLIHDEYGMPRVEQHDLSGGNIQQEQRETVEGKQVIGEPATLSDPAREGKLDESCEQDSLVDTHSEHTADNEADIESQAESQELDDLTSDEVVLLTEGSDNEQSESPGLNDTDSMFDSISASTTAGVGGACEAATSAMSNEDLVHQVPDPIHTDTADSQSSTVSSVGIKNLSQEPVIQAESEVTQLKSTILPETSSNTEAGFSNQEAEPVSTGSSQDFEKQQPCAPGWKENLSDEAAGCQSYPVSEAPGGLQDQAGGTSDISYVPQISTQGDVGAPQTSENLDSHVKSENQVEHVKNEILDDGVGSIQTVQTKETVALAADADGKEKPGTPQPIIHDIRPLTQINPEPVMSSPTSIAKLEPTVDPGITTVTSGVAPPSTESVLSDTKPVVDVCNMPKLKTECRTSPSPVVSDTQRDSKSVSRHSPLEQQGLTLPPSTYARFTENKQALEAGVQRAQKDGSPISDATPKDASQSCRPIVRKFFTSRDAKQSPSAAVLLAPVSKPSPTPCIKPAPAPLPKPATSTFSPADLTKFLVESIQSSEALTPQKIQATVLKLVREKWPEVNRQNGGGPRFTLSSDLKSFKIIVDVGPGKPPCTIQFAQTTKQNTQGSTPEKKTLVTVKGGAGLQKELNEALKGKTQVTIKPKGTRIISKSASALSPSNPVITTSVSTAASKSSPGGAVTSPKVGTASFTSSQRTITGGPSLSPKTSVSGPTLSPKSSAIFQSRMQSYRKLASSFNLSGVQSGAATTVPTSVSPAKLPVYSTKVLPVPVSRASFPASADSVDAVTSANVHVSQTLVSTVTTPTKSHPVSIKAFKLNSSPSTTVKSTTNLKTPVVETTCTTSVLACSVQAPSCVENTRSVSSCTTTTSVLPITTCVTSPARITLLSDRNPESKGMSKSHLKNLDTKGFSELNESEKAANTTTEETTSSEKCKKPSQRKRRCDSSDSAKSKKHKSAKKTKEMTAPASDSLAKDELHVDGEKSQSSIGDSSSSDEEEKQVAQRALRNIPGRSACLLPPVSKHKNKPSKSSGTESSGAAADTKISKARDSSEKKAEKRDRKTSKSRKLPQESNCSQKSKSKDIDGMNLSKAPETIKCSQPAKSSSSQDDSSSEHSKEIRKTPVKSRLRHRPHMASYWEEDWSSGSDDSSDEDAKATATVSKPKHHRKKTGCKLSYDVTPVESTSNATHEEIQGKLFTTGENDESTTGKLESPKDRIKHDDSGYIKAFADWVSDGITMVDTASETGSDRSSPMKEMSAKPVGLKTYSRLCPTVSPENTPTSTIRGVSDNSSSTSASEVAPPTKSSAQIHVSGASVVGTSKLPSDTKSNKTVQISQTSPISKIQCSHPATKVICIPKRMPTSKGKPGSSDGFQNAFANWSETKNLREQSEEPSGSDLDDGENEREFTDWFRGKTYQSKNVQNMHAHVSPQPKISRAEEQFLQVLAKEKVKKSPISDSKSQAANKTDTEEQTIKDGEMETSVQHSGDSVKNEVVPEEGQGSSQQAHKESELEKVLDYDSLINSDSDSEIDFPKDAALRRSSSVESRCSKSSSEAIKSPEGKGSKSTDASSTADKHVKGSENSSVKDFPMRSKSRPGNSRLQSREASPLPGTVLSQKSREKLKTSSREASPASLRGRRSMSRETDSISPAAITKHEPSPCAVPAKRRKGELEILLDVDLKFDASPKSRSSDSSTRSKGLSRESSPAMLSPRRREADHHRDSPVSKKDTDSSAKLREDGAHATSRGHHRTRTKPDDPDETASVDSSKDRSGGGIDSRSASRERGKDKSSSVHSGKDSRKEKSRYRTSGRHASTHSTSASRETSKDRDKEKARSYILSRLKTDTVSGDSVNSRGKRVSLGKKSTPGTAVKRKLESDSTVSSKRRTEDSSQLAETSSKVSSPSAIPRRLSQRKSTSPWETEHLKRLGKL